MNLTEHAIDLVTADLLAKLKAGDKGAEAQLRALVSESLRAAQPKTIQLPSSNVPSVWGDPVPALPLTTLRPTTTSIPWGTDIQCGCASTGTGTLGVIATN